MNGEHVFDIETINLQDNPDVLDSIIEACLKRKRELTSGTKCQCCTIKNIRG